MKTYIMVFVTLALCSVTLPVQASGDLPSTNPVAKYERCDSVWNWREVSQSEGETVLTCIRDMAHFKTWGSTVPPDILADPIPAVFGFRIVTTSGQTNVVHFSSNGEFVDCSKGLLVVPDKEEKLLAQILTKWRESDSTRISSQPLPYKYRIGSADDGGTLSGISRLFYRDARKWQQIYEANKTVIKNPDIVERGMVITIPKLKESSNQSAAGTR